MLKVLFFQHFKKPLEVNVEENALSVTETSLLNILRCPDQLVIPFYHRCYRWSSPQWRDFWKSALRGGRRESGRCFMGVIYTCKQDKGRVEIVDGMHRLVTAVLLLAALRDVFHTASDHLPLPLLDVPLDKFLLLGADDWTLRRIIEGQPQTAECSRRMFNVHRYFMGQAKNLSEAGHQEIYRGLTGLKVLWVELDHRTDDPQSIYLSENN